MEDDRHPGGRVEQLRDALLFLYPFFVFSFSFIRFVSGEEAQLLPGRTTRWPLGSLVRKDKSWWICM